MLREGAKDLFRNDMNSYGSPKAVMTKIDMIYDDIEADYRIQEWISTKDKIRLKQLKPNSRVLVTDGTEILPAWVSPLFQFLENKGDQYEYTNIKYFMVLPKLPND